MPIRPPMHRPAHYKPYSALKRESDNRRENSHDRGYNHRWRKARGVFLRQHPLCKECERKGIIISANTVDHIIPHKGNDTLFWDETNWQSLCQSCHSIKTMNEGSFGN